MMNTDLLRFFIAKKLFRLIYPRYVFSEWGNDWASDFQTVCDRHFMLGQLVKLVEGLDGDLVECGAYRGESVLALLENSEGQFHVFDSFEGLSEPDGMEKRWWRRGDLSAATQEFMDAVESYQDRVCVYQGWIPTQFHYVRDFHFRFVHVDVDLAEPTRECVEFFWPRVVGGGVMVFDDYGFRQCAEARRVIDGYFPQDEIIQLTTGQAFVVKRGGRER